MNQREFNIGNLVFTLGYLTDVNLIKNYDNGYGYRAIGAVLKLEPNQKITERQADEIIDSNAELILSEFSKVINEYPEVYQHFDYELRLERGSSSTKTIYPYYLISKELRIIIKLKKGIS